MELLSNQPIMPRFALTRSDRWKAGVAALKGAVILVLGISIIANVVAKVISGVPPSSTLMLIFGAAALIANLICLSLLWSFRKHDMNMASTFECSRNDVISNCGVLLAAGAVAFTASAWPDVIIGSAMAVLVLRSAYRVVGDAVPELLATRV